MNISFYYHNSKEILIFHLCKHYQVQVWPQKLSKCPRTCTPWYPLQNLPQSSLLRRDKMPSTQSWIAETVNHWRSLSTHFCSSKVGKQPSPCKNLTGLQRWQRSEGKSFFCKKISLEYTGQGLDFNSQLLNMRPCLALHSSQMLEKSMEYVKKFAHAY